MTVLPDPIIKVQVLLIVPVPPKVAEFVPANVKVPPLTNKVLVTESDADKVSVTELVASSDFIEKAPSTVGANVVPPPINTSSPGVGVWPDAQFEPLLQFTLLPPVQVAVPA
ncbi:hypothetical protein [uncultured Mucilaginibacter sp.]|uniref:hypothetical protein n=1 Tax=uncultured Mucilaginibacter sp. TaxID=797541 RepID=UPI0025FAE20D|nr:hypothetical protein [uncultured Mucilaginibacter sp.]